MKPKRQVVTTLISDKILVDFKPKSVTRDKEGLYIMRKDNFIKRIY